jgi:hypothetical protein
MGRDPLGPPMLSGRALRVPNGGDARVASNAAAQVIAASPAQPSGQD